MDKRSLLAIVLCMAIFFLWTSVIMPRLYPPEKPAAAPAVVPAAAPKAGPAVPVDAPKPAVPAPAASVVRHEVKPPFELKSKMLRVTMSNQGAGILELVLTDPGVKGEVPLLRPFDAQHPHFALRRLGGPEGEALETAAWELVERTGLKAEFRLLLQDGLEITKTFELDPQRHTLSLNLMIDNKNLPVEGKPAPADVPIRLELLAFNGLDPDSGYRFDQYLSGAWSYENAVVFKPLAEVESGEVKLAEALRLADPAKRADAVKSAEALLKEDRGHKGWLGLKSRFFAVLVQPDKSSLDALESYWFRTLPPVAAAKFAAEGKGNRNIAVSLRTLEMRVSKRKLLRFDGFAGPQKTEILKELPGAEELQKFSTGCWGISPIVNLVAPLILGTLKLTGSLLGNFGVGIIVTTLLIKLVVFPLTLKSQRSMAAMQQLGPKIQALRAKYGSDQQKFGMEQMKLFRENKVNPMAGCLPMLIQMPVFIGMYSVFEQSSDLRGAPFFLWIKDLSQPDHLIGPWTPVVINLFITTLSIDAFNLLPIVMTLTWFLQAYFTPRSPDPQMASQQKMMMFMPVMFGLMCYGLASGLSLYFLVNSLLGMGEMKLIKKVFLPQPEPAKP